jgi:hypothetical protein
MRGAVVEGSPEAGDKERPPTPERAVRFSGVVMGTPREKFLYNEAIQHRYSAAFESEANQKSRRNSLLGSPLD